MKNTDGPVLFNGRRYVNGVCVTKEKYDEAVQERKRIWHERRSPEAKAAKWRAFLARQHPEKR